MILYDHSAAPAIQFLISYSKILLIHINKNTVTPKAKALTIARYLAFTSKRAGKLLNSYPAILIENFQLLTITRCKLGNLLWSRAVPEVLGRLRVQRVWWPEFRPVHAWNALKTMYITTKKKRRKKKKKIASLNYFQCKVHAEAWSNPWAPEDPIPARSCLGHTISNSS